jgi:SAM-dependent methyltransferase
MASQATPKCRPHQIDFHDHRGRPREPLTDPRRRQQGPRSFQAAHKTDHQKETRVKLTYMIPLFAFLLPTLVIGYGVVIPHMCTIQDVTRALTEMRRVLKPGGRLLFAEHGRSSEPRVVRWQDRLTPIWRQIGGGCHLNRPIEQLIREAGFRVEQLQTGYMKGPKPMTFMYEVSPGRNEPSRRKPSAK